MTFQIALVDLGTKHLEDLHLLLSSYGDVKVIGYDVDFSGLKIDLLVLSGGSRLTYRSPLFLHIKNFLSTTEIPVVGICLGAQVIASTYQSHFYKNPIKISGIQQIRMLDSGNTFEVFEAHRFCVDELGPELEGIAGSEICYEIFRHKTKPQLGIQFHPEVHQPINHGKALFDEMIRGLLQTSTSL